MQTGCSAVFMRTLLCADQGKRLRGTGVKLASGERVEGKRGSFFAAAKQGHQYCQCFRRSVA